MPEVDDQHDPRRVLSFTGRVVQVIPRVVPRARYALSVLGAVHEAIVEEHAPPFLPPYDFLADGEKTQRRRSEPEERPNRPQDPRRDTKRRDERPHQEHVHRVQHAPDRQHPSAPPADELILEPPAQDRPTTELLLFFQKFTTPAPTFILGDAKREVHAQPRVTRPAVRRDERPGRQLAQVRRRERAPGFLQTLVRNLPERGRLQRAQSRHRRRKRRAVDLVLDPVAPQVHRAPLADALAHRRVERREHAVATSCDGREFHLRRDCLGGSFQNDQIAQLSVTLFGPQLCAPARLALGDTLEEPARGDREWSFVAVVAVASVHRDGGERVQSEHRRSLQPAVEPRPDLRPAVPRQRHDVVGDPGEGRILPSVEHHNLGRVLRELERVRGGRAPQAPRIRARIRHVVVVRVECASERRLARGFHRGRVGPLTGRVVAGNTRDAAEPRERVHAAHTAAARYTSPSAPVVRHGRRDGTLLRFPGVSLLHPPPHRLDRGEHDEQ
mmetsp:Transcript_1481/g.6623  ORF Transcript_1481/g.6623 Transcript_1481/m.6623 type:complete len:499 (-) Transcript_1481:394-1890(-)